MQAYRIEATITPDGKINLPKNFEKLFNHKVELVLHDKENVLKKNKLNIPILHCGGKVSDFTREELYESRFKELKIIVP
jgi:hypothetical protein